MKHLKILWKNRATKIWMIVSAALAVFFTVASLVVTQSSFISGTIDVVFGGKRAIIAETTGIYTTEYKDKREVLAAASDLNVDIASEGTILLKNENALPLAAGAKISVFGQNSINLVYGGSGSGGMSTADAKKLYDSLSAAGFETNGALKSFYENSGVARKQNPGIGSYNLVGFATGEAPVDSAYDSVRSTYASYNAAALVVISRIGGEGFDMPRTMETAAGSGTMITGARSIDDHYLQLDAYETALLKEANDNFSNVIVIINSSQAMELGFLDDPTHYAYQPNIKGALWIGSPGGSGIMALGKLLKGEVNPSGRTADTYARDFKKDPTWFNFGDNRQEDSGNRYTINGQAQNAFFVEYEEGIYSGYRYYETRGATDGESWYRDNVVFPFGYGESYTDFSWTVTRLSHPAGAVAADAAIEIDVKVTNDGDFAGKDMVQLYYTAPYTPEGIEKSHTVLGAYEKTDLIAPGQSDTVTLKINVSDMKSYDYNDANDNGFKGYELEAGAYRLNISKDAHTTVETVEYTVAADVKYDRDGVENRFDDVSARIQKYLSRNDWEGTWPAAPTASDREVTQAFIDSLTYSKNDNGPWKTDVMPKQSGSEQRSAKIQLEELIGVDYENGLWDELLDQLTVRQMAEFIGSGLFGSKEIESIGKPLVTDSDGPAGFANFMSVSGAVYDTFSYVSECILAATWNDELAYAMGEMIGHEGLVGNLKGDKLPYSGWYAPGVNIHRSPFGGRNWEYYSEDPFLSGQMAANVVQGAKSKGVYPTVKHFAVNDQETHRDLNGLITWVNEQAMREIYLRPFEIAVKEGEATGIMSSFNRIGTVWAGGSYALLTEVLRGEWGFHGFVGTDFAVNTYLDSEQMIRAGGDLLTLQLDEDRVPEYKNADATQVALLRKATKNILYIVVNSNAMNNKISGYRMAYWRLGLMLFDFALIIGLGIWGFFVIRKVYKKEKAQAGQNPLDAKQ